MTLPETIVARLLNEEHFDVHQHPEIYRPTSGTHPDGRKIVDTCGYCEAEYGADRQYPPDVAVSHGMCGRHQIEMRVNNLGYTPEQAAAKVTPNAAPDWQEALGAPAGAAAPPKATFWVTSGGLD